MTLMTVEEFGRRIKVGRASAYRIVAARQVDVTDVGTGDRPRLRVSEKALEKYVAARTEQGSAA
jgi:hypothetical protein